MIDFRYHLVSLISVFLALAVGIILGAGPLQDAIGNQLQGQVDQLRSERNDLRGQLDAADSAALDSQEFIAATGPQLLAGTLTGKRVAIVDLDAVVDSRDEAFVEEFTSAGATVVAQVQLGEDWTDPGAARDRKTVASGLGDLLPDSDADASPEQRLADALVLALTEESSTTPGNLGDNAVQLTDQLEQFSLVTVAKEQTQPADVILLVSGGTPAPGTDEKATGSPQSATTAVDIQLDLALASAQGADAVVVAGPTTATGDLISKVRGDGKASDRIATVSGIEAEPGMISVPLALAAGLGGTVGQYGFEDGVTGVLPVLPASSSATDGSTPATETTPDPVGDAPASQDPSTTTDEG